MINIQYIVRDGNVYVIEVNPRSSRTVPFLSKVTGVSMRYVRMVYLERQKGEEA